jgi:hypothetical protein
MSLSVPSVHSWVVDRMVSWSPPGRSFIQEAKETPEEGKARYGEIAEAILSVAYDPSEPPLFGGRNGRARTAAVLLSVARMESGFRRDVDLNLGKLARGDGGRSWCLMQVQLGSPMNGKTKTRILFEGDGVSFTSDPGLGFGGEDLIADRRVCVRTGLRMMRRSFSACSRLNVLDKLSAYTTGSCQSGQRESRARVRLAIDWVSQDAPPMSDSEVLAQLFPVAPSSSEPSVVSLFDSRS